MLHPTKNKINQLFEAGNHQAAYQLLTSYVTEYPQDSSAVYQLAVWAYKSMDWQRANELMGQLLTLPDAKKYYHVVVDYYVQTSDLKSAIKYQKQVTHNNDTQALFKLAMLYFKFFDFENAEKTFNQLLSIVPNDPQILGTIADIEHGNGQFSQAIKKYKQILTIDPNNEAAFNGIIKSTKFKYIDSELEVIAEKILQSSSTTPEQKAQVHISLGKMYDDCKDYKKAWHNFSQGNDIHAKLFPFSTQDLDKQVSEIKSSFTKTLFEGEQTGDDSFSPIFIIGMPRSGTTLLEQVLESTGVLCGVGESPALNKAINRRLYNIKYPIETNQASEQTFKDMANDYVDYIANCHVNGSKRSVDKLPGNFLHLGLLKKMFPNAKFVNMTRNKWDCCLSIYFQMFSNTMSFTTDISNIEHFHDVYHDIMAYWQQLFPENIYHLSYEKLVNNFKGETQSLFEFLELAWSDDVTNFVNSKNSVHTPSSWQVRQGINNKAVGRSEHYLGFIKQNSK